MAFCIAEKQEEGKCLVRILFCIRGDYLTNFAGDSRQLLKTADYLRKKGVSVTVNCGEITDYKNFDLVHLFNLTRITETYHFFKTAQKFHKPIVITPIYRDLQKYYRYIGDRQAASLWNCDRAYRREIIKGCQMVYPSSLLEKNALEKDHGGEFPCCLVYNGTSKPEEPFNSPDFYSKLISLKPYLFCAARICPRKNQLELCKVAGQLGLHVVLAGTINSRSYFEQCLGCSNVHYYGVLDENSLRTVYANAVLHVLCGFAETSGLANLEAGLCGTDIVSTSEGCAAEYFGDLSGYCNPYRQDDLKRALLSALSGSRQPSLKQHIEAHFFWENCLFPLLESYQKLLK